MGIIRRILDALTERIIPIIASLFAHRVETIVALTQAEHQDELEERARQFEREGKAHLAAALRNMAVQISPDKPGAQGLKVIRHLQQEDIEVAMPLLGNHQQQTPHEPEPAEANPEQSAPRRSFERRPRRPGGNEPS